MPIASIYGRFAYIYHQNQPKVGKYAIHGSHGIETGLTRWESRLLVWTFGEDGHENDATFFEWRGMMAHDRSDLATRIVTLVCLRWFFTSYHSKSRLNHHLGCIFPTTLSKYKFTIYLRHEFFGWMVVVNKILCKRQVQRLECMCPLFWG